MKSKHLVRMLGEHSDINTLQADEIEAYADQRLREGASHHTVNRELITRMRALRVANRRKLFTGSLDALKLAGFSARYVPRDRRSSTSPQCQLKRPRHLVMTGPPCPGT
jgi:hypothetical protein